MVPSRGVRNGVMRERDDLDRWRGVVAVSYTHLIFPAKFSTHYAITAALMARPGIPSPDAIRAVRIIAADVPSSDRQRPRSGLDGKFSLQYTAAAALLDGQVGLASFTDERLARADMQALPGKIEVKLSRDIPSIYTAGRYLDLEVTLADGSAVRTRCERPRGSWGAAPITEEEHHAKARDCLATFLSPDAVAASVVRCDAIDSLDPSGVRALLRLASTGAVSYTHLDVYKRQAGDAPAAPVEAADRPLRHGDIVIASIASCTNTANPYQMIAAGLLARNAVAKGLRAKPWIKTSFSPGSRVVPAMLTKAGLTEGLDALGFNLVGFGCMSCGSGSGALAENVTAEIAARNLVAVGVISSNRNFDGRLNGSVRGTFLASPPLVVAYAIVGSILHDLTSEKLGDGPDGRPVFLADLWPDDAEIRATLDRALTGDLFRDAYDVFADPGPEWANIPHNTAPVFAWDSASLFLRRPPFLDIGGDGGAPISGARILLMLGDDLTTDHISPGSTIPADTDAGAYLAEHGVPVRQFGSYIGRRANHEVMIRGTFANVRLRNELVTGREGGFTRHQPSGDVMSVFHACLLYTSRCV